MASSIANASRASAAAGARREGKTPSSLRRKLALDESGSLLPLTIFFGFLSLVLVLLVTAASSLYLERQRLFTLADGAAIAGAEGFLLSAVAPTANGVRATLNSAEVASAVTGYLADTPNSFDTLRVERAGTVDGRSCTVTLSTFWRAPMLTLFVPAGVRIEVTAVGRSVFW